MLDPHSTIYGISEQEGKVYGPQLDFIVGMRIVISLNVFLFLDFRISSLANFSPSLEIYQSYGRERVHQTP